MTAAAPTWAQVHVGDTVRGADQRAWTVIERGSLPAWVIGGERGWFRLRLGDREVTTEQRLNEPVPLVALIDHTGEATAVGALINNGLHVTLVEETLTVTTATDPFTAATPSDEPKHDRFGRYLLPDPTTGKERAWTRVSTIARTLADEYNLNQWKLRQAVRGVALRPDLIAAAAAAEAEDRDALNGIAQQAMDFAESRRGANLGTALHSFTQRLDRGEPLASLRAPAPLEADLTSYAELLKTAGLSVEASERVVILPEIGAAGRFDRLVHQPPGKAKAAPTSVLDLKTGKDLSYAWLEIAIQLALYARAPLMWDPAAGAYVSKPAVDLARALVVHLPVGKAKAQLYGVNIASGWAAAQTAIKVREMRSAAKSLAWVVEPDDPATVALHNVSRAASREDLAALWESLNKRGLWTEEVNAAAQTRFAQLQTTTV